MGAVAEWLVIGVPATAKSDRGAPGETELTALGIDDLKVAFDPDRAVIVDGYLGGGHLTSPVKHKNLEFKFDRSSFTRYAESARNSTPGPSRIRREF
jgi:hypothetical protein